jgi:hypothetical protein
MAKRRKVNQYARGVRLKVGDRKPLDKQALRENLVLQLTKKLYKQVDERARLSKRLKELKREMKTTRSAIRAALQSQDAFEYDSVDREVMRAEDAIEDGQAQ